MPDTPKRDRDTLQPGDLLSTVLRSRAESQPSAPAIRFKGETLSYGDVNGIVSAMATRLRRLGHSDGARIAVHLPNCPQALISAFAAFEAGAIFVPINPLYRRRQILHVLADCNASILVTTRYLFRSIEDGLAGLSCLESVVFIDTLDVPDQIPADFQTFDWNELTAPPPVDAVRSTSGASVSDPAVIFYTSGSTGRAKGVTVSHQNIIDGARIVSGYLENSPGERVLAALPLSFDYGFSQATTMVYVGGELVLTNYTLPQTLLGELAQCRATGLAGVPTMWAQLASLRWPTGIADHLKYVTNSGGRLPENVLTALRRQIPDSRVYLMYGLTEAFRSSYLDPALVGRRPDSIGKAIPEVELHVVRPDGSLCAPNEPGELVHAGALVALGYWNDTDATNKRFRPFPVTSDTEQSSSRAVWSGDIVTRDEDGFLYFVERADSMMKCSGYRISPTEIEETIYESGLVEQVAAIGIPDLAVGQRIGLAVVPKSSHEETDFAIRHVCARELPPYMQPDEIIILEALILTANGKPDRLAMEKLFKSRLQV